MSGAIFEAVGAVHDCGEPAVVLDANLEVATLTLGLAPDQLLLILKWLFIEQDLTYWGHRGRDMLMRGIEKDVLGVSSD